MARSQALDWDVLRAAWRESGQPLVTFLRANQIDPRCGGARRGIAKWGIQSKESWHTLLPHNAGMPYESPRMLARISDAIDLLKKQPEPAPEAQPDPPLVNEDGTILQPPGVIEAMCRTPDSQRIDVAHASVQQLWAMFGAWRRTQSVADYTIADKIRWHASKILDAFIDGDTTTATATELNRIAQVCETVQRIQRLALGLSTQNIGLEKPEDQVKVEESKEKGGLPTYIVEVNRGGRFVRPRPRIVDPVEVDVTPPAQAQAVNA